ncbi:hypothetical protein KJ695_00115 [Patescibacteria group bacterium]|nr:hypothetical protein [Patescibacteria group bacterium]MBU4056304.1 hypothetical protein [Patescibacteria group bacterium]MBU4368293.1 hypothetical protein [Patescibacteria group bacterium]
MDIGDDKWFIEISTQTIFIAPICERMKRMPSGGVQFKHFSNFGRFIWVNIYSTSFWIIDVANRSPAGPYAISDFLS